MAAQLISDRETRVKYMLGNRTDLTTRIRGWLRDAYLEIGMGYPFEELEFTIEDVLTADQESMTYPDTVRALKAVTVIDQTSGATRELDQKDIRIIRRYSTTSRSKPSIYAPFKNLIIFRPIADKAYDIILDVWNKPAIETTIQNTPLLVADDWLEIIDYAAAMRGHIELIERDKAAELKQLLYAGIDPNVPSKQPGLIKQKLLRRQAEVPARDFGVRPRIRQYTNVQ